MKRLPGGGEAGGVVRRRLDVVEAKDGDVFGDAETVLANGADCTDGCEVVEGDDGGERFFSEEQLARGGITELRRGHVEGDGEGELGVDGDAQLDGNFAKAVPAVVGVGAAGRAAHDGDLAMAKIVEMPEAEFGGESLVQGEIGYVRDRLMGGDGDDGDRPGFASCRWRVDQDEAFDSTVHEETRILL